MAQLRVPGGRLYCDVAGPADAPAVLFLHAGVATNAMWDAQFADLARDHRVARYDLRGFGQTISDAQPFSNRADAIAVLDAAGMQRATLVGGSRGGTIAIDTALEYPERVAGIVAIGSAAGGMPLIDPTPAEKALDDEIEALLDAGKHEQALRREVDLWWVGASRSAADLDPEFVNIATAMNLANLPMSGLDYSPIPFDPPAWTRILDLTVPALFAVGDADLSEVVANTRTLATTVAGSELQVLSNTAHIPSVEVADAVTSMLRDWLTRHGL